MTVLGRAGLYLKHALVAMDLSRIDTVVFDKTGTLTTAGTQPDASPDRFDAEAWRSIQALASHSVHPFSRALAGARIDGMRVTHVAEHPGLGVSGLVNGQRVAIGSPSFISAETGHDITDESGSTWASVDERTPRRLGLPTTARPGVDTAVATFSRRFETWLLSGDRAPASSSVWRSLFGDRLRFRQSPEDKLAAVTSLQDAGRRVLMLGDGLNDAGALAAATVGIAVSDDTACLVPACDAVLQGDRVRALPDLVAYARRVPRVIAFCFAVSVLYNVAGIGLALAGALTPLVTAILMPVSSIAIVALSTGLMRIRVPEIAS
jgi:Cu+-exporting ATPase